MLKFIRTLNRELDGTIARNRVILGQQEKIVAMTAPGGFLPAGTPTAPAAPGAPAAPTPAGTPPARGSGGGGAASASGGQSGGHGRIQGAQLVFGQRGAGARTAAELDRDCRRVEDIAVYLVGVAEPVKVPGWRCPDGSEYLDPEAHQALLAGRYRPRGLSSSGGTSSGGSSPRNPFPDRVTNANAPTGPVHQGAAPSDVVRNYGAAATDKTGAEVLASAIDRLGQTLGEDRRAEADQSRAAAKANAAALTASVGQLRTVLQEEFRRKPTGIEARARGRDF